MQRKFRDTLLKEIAGDGTFTWWRYVDQGIDEVEMLEAGFFDPFQHNALQQSRIRVNDRFMLHGKNGIIDALVVDCSKEAPFTPVLAILQEMKPQNPWLDQEASKKKAA